MNVPLTIDCSFLDARQVADLTSGLLRGENRLITGVAPLEFAGENQLTLCVKPQPVSVPDGTVVLVPRSWEAAPAEAVSLILVENPKTALGRVLKHLESTRAEFRIAGSAIVHSQARLTGQAAIGEFTIVEAQAELGANVSLGHHVVIGEGTTIGDQTIIRDGCIIGREGLGIYWDQDRLEMMPHLGRVSIGKHVFVGAQTVISRATLGVTEIGDGTKIGPMVDIAHNVRIGQECQIAGGAILCGSCVIGNRVFVGAGAMIKNKVAVADGATIGMGAVVIRDVPAGTTVSGPPALSPRDLAKWMRPACKP